MSCMSASLTRVGGGKMSLSRVGDIINTRLSRIGGNITASTSNIGGSKVSLNRIGGDISISLSRTEPISCKIKLICSSGVTVRYLEIEPTMIWVYPDIESINNVYSNTQWNVL